MPDEKLTTEEKALVTRMRQGIERAQGIIKEQAAQIGQMTADVQSYGVVLDVHREQVDSYQMDRRFPKGSWFKVVSANTNGDFLGQVGRITKPGVDQWGDRQGNWMATAQMVSGEEIQIDLRAGKIAPLVPSDSDYVVVYTGNQIVRCAMPADHELATKLKFGQNVFLYPPTMQITGIADDSVIKLGAIHTVAEVLEDGNIVIQDGDSQKTVLCSYGITPRAGDRVRLDPTGIIVRQVLPKPQEHKLTIQIDTLWDQIGGLATAKDELRYVLSALGSQASKRVNAAYPNLKRSKGILLYGMPGNGKTLLAKAAARELAGGSRDVGYFSVRGPELLSRFVGETEQAIRNLYEQANEYFSRTGKVPVIFFDEADSLFPVRGSGISSDVNKTIVAQFLALQDGLESQNALVIMASNRADLIDPAVTRPGRIDKHIRVGLSGESDVREILGIHLAGVPAKDDDLTGEIVKALYHTSLNLYHLDTSKGRVDFRLADCVSGAMIAGVVSDAQERAYRRDAKSGRVSGVGKPDICAAVYKQYSTYRDLDAVEMLRQYAADHALQIKDVERAENVSQEVLDA